MVSYGYNADSEVTSENTAGLAGAASSTYTYDEADRLTSWNNGSTTTSYGYDKNGNLTQFGSKAYTYDARDELAGDGTSSYAYTARGTSSAEPGPGGPLAVTSDAYGDQLTAGTRAYAYDALGRLAGDTASGGPNYAFTYVGASGTLASDGSSAYTWDPSGSRLAGAGVVGGGTSGVQALTDSHGNLVGQFTPSAASVSASKAYDPWGNVTATTGTPVGLLGYQSAWSDAVAGKDLMGARWYDPAAGDFTSRDTAVVSPDPDPAAGNPFAYAADEPLDFTDPTGHYIVPSGTPTSAGTTARVGSTSVTSSSNYVADVAAAREIQAAAAKATTSEAKPAAAKAAAVKVQAQQNAAAKKAKQQQAQAKQQKQQQAKQQATENNANMAKVQRMEQVQLDRDAVRASAAASQMDLIPVGLGTFRNINPGAPELGIGVLTFPVGDQRGEFLPTPVGPSGLLIFITRGAPDLGIGVLKTPVSGQGSIINASQEFPNLEPWNMPFDEGDAIFFGVTPAAPGTAAFGRTIATAPDGVIKWAVTKGLGLRIMPAGTADTIDLYHSVLSGGDPVLAAGEAKIVTWEGQYYGEEITYHSGHFLPEGESLDICINAFRDAGIEFNETGSY